MSRRDTIIIAVLVNLSLLSLLFMIAINQEEPEPSTISISQSSANKANPTQKFTEENTFIPLAFDSVDEIDSALNDFVAHNTEEIIPEIPVNKNNVQKTINSSPSIASKEALNKECVEIIVRRGDALEKIARANGTTVEAIRACNSLKNDSLQVGMSLKVPLPSSKQEKGKPMLTAIGSVNKDDKNEISNISEHYYTVKSGDSPWKISKQFHLNLDELLLMNNLNEEKARNLKIGEKIRIK